MVFVFSPDAALPWPLFLHGEISTVGAFLGFLTMPTQHRCSVSIPLLELISLRNPWAQAR
jgi:hypothetical protein